MRRLDNLGEDSDIVAAEIDALALAPELRRKVVEIFGPALDRQAKVVRQLSGLPAAITWNDDVWGGHPLPRPPAAGRMRGRGWRPRESLGNHFPLRSRGALPPHEP